MVLMWRLHKQWSKNIPAVSFASFCCSCSLRILCFAFVSHRFSVGVRALADPPAAAGWPTIGFLNTQKMVGDSRVQINKLVTLATTNQHHQKMPSRWICCPGCNTSVKITGFLNHIQFSKNPLCNQARGAEGDSQSDSPSNTESVISQTLAQAAADKECGFLLCGLDSATFGPESANSNDFDTSDPTGC